MMVLTALLPLTFLDVLKLIPTHLPSTECWEYQGFLNHDGYGQYTDKQHKTKRAHREMFRHSCEPVSSNEVVRHTCDNRACCNPNHLIKGSQKDNMRDCVERGRLPSRAGEINGRATITRATALDIRKVYSSGMWSYGLLAQLFDMPRSTIINIIKERTWK